jgi:hypothetical protein
VRAAGHRLHLGLVLLEVVQLLAQRDRALQCMRACISYISGIPVTPSLVKLARAQARLGANVLGC